jgi:hypothetical protein
METLDNMPKRPAPWRSMGRAPPPPTRLAASGRTDEGTALLRPVFERFTEGLATPDLLAAKALLDALE